MRTLEDLSRTLSSDSPSAVRATAAAGMTAYPDDDVTWARLTQAERDPDPAVATAASAALDAIFKARPELLFAVCRRNDLHGAGGYLGAVERYLARLPSSFALTALYDVLEHADAQQWARLLEGAASPQRFPTEMLQALLKKLGDDRQRRWVVAQLLACRDLPDGYEVLLDEYGSPSLMDGFIARGIGALRHLFETVYGQATDDYDVAERLAKRQRTAEAMVHELALDPSSRAAGVAVQVLGYWDSQKSIETLVHVAGDPAYLREIRDDALDSLCKLEAPEGVDVMTAAIGDRAVNDDTRHSCVIILGAIGNAGPLGALEAIANGDDAHLAGAAKEAIERIQRPFK